MQTTTSNQFRLSPQQKRAWVLQRDSRSFRTQAACLIEGELRVETLRRAVRSVVERHEAFRTRIAHVPGLKFPVQEVVEEARYSELSPSDLNVAADEPDFFALLGGERARHDSAGDDHPLSVTIIPVAAARHVVVVSAASLVADSSTLRNFFAELAGEFDSAGRPAVAVDPVQYADYAVWRNELWEQDAELTEEGRAFWQKNLNLKSLDCRLPSQAPAEACSSFAPAFVPARIPASVRAKLASLADRSGVSLESLLLASWASLLHRFTQSAEVTVGVVFEGRSYEELLSGMGPYAQTVPALINFPPGLSFQRLLSKTADSINEAGLWQDYFGWPEAADAAPRFCPFAFSWKPRPQTHVAGGLTFTVCAESSVAERFELQLSCSDDGEGIAGTLAYDPDCFTPHQVEQLARRWEGLCAAAAENAERAVVDLPVLTPEDRRQLLVEWNATEDTRSAPRCVHHCFEEQVEKTPEATAVVCGDRELSYRELNEQANRLARRLREAGVGPDTPVCLFIGRSVEMIVGLLAILKADGAYVPLDTAYPVTERIAHIIEDTGVPVILTHERLRRHVPEGLCQVISVDADPSISSYASENLAGECGPENLAYIIYTSGSTGKPKGVMVQHGSVVNLWSGLGKAIYDRSPGGPLRASLNAPTSFDASIKQLLLLLGGHALHVITEEVRGNPDHFVSYLRENRIDVLDCTPSHLRLLIDAGLLDADGGSSSVALIGGEAIDAALWRRLADSRAIRFYNVYGPTECTGDATARAITPDYEQASIGTPLANVRTYILSESLDLQPVGVPGELYIAGAGLARGYWDRPALTAERFIPNPFAARPGERLYKTGDLARHLPDGNIEYIGRADHQVKIRGFRVELGEISAALLEHPRVREAVVTVREDTSGGKRLVGYVVPEASENPSAAELRQHLQSQLPEYMIPTAFVTLDALPLTANNKIDRAALPIPDQLRPELCADFQLPATPIEVALAAIWQSVLGIEQVGVRDNFFELGGHSLLAMQVISRVRKEFAVDIVVPRLFQKPTIEGLALAVEEATGRKTRASAPIPALPRGTKGFDQFKDRLSELAGEQTAAV